MGNDHMTKDEVKARWPKAVCKKGQAGYAVYTRNFGARISGWMTNRRAAWENVAKRTAEWA